MAVGARALAIDTLVLLFANARQRRLPRILLLSRALNRNSFAGIRASARTRGNNAAQRETTVSADIL